MTQKIRKNCHLHTIWHNFVGLYLRSYGRHVLTIGKKLIKQQYLLHMSSQYSELRPLTAEIGWRVWDTSADFNRFHVLASLFFTIWSTAFNRRRHVHSAGRPSRWASAHFLVLSNVYRYAGPPPDTRVTLYTSTHLPTTALASELNAWTKI